MTGPQRGDFERFIDFLQREAAEYHAPPDTPREAIWRAIADARGVDPARSPQLEELDERLATAASGYHAPPDAPREEMWERISGAWELRRSASGEARTAGLEPLSPVRWDDRTEETGAVPQIEPAPRERHARRTAVAGLAIAASLILAFALGRGTAPADGDMGPQTAMLDTPQAVDGSPDGGSEPLDESAALAGRSEGGPVTQPPAREAVPPARIETRLATASANEPPENEPDEALSDQPHAVASELAYRATRETATRYVLARHFERADALLSSFDAGSAAPSLNGAVAAWADGLLSETRLLLSLPEEHRNAVATRLLEELELILTQIALLDPESSRAERRLIGEALQGTAGRIRAASGPGGALVAAGT